MLINTLLATPSTGGYLATITIMKTHLTCVSLSREIRPERQFEHMVRVSKSRPLVFGEKVAMLEYI